MQAPKTLTDTDPDFPAIEYALEEPNGLLAIGGDLSVKRLLDAYSKGIFPWYSENQPILWWSPDPRAVLFFDKVKISRSLAKSLKSLTNITFNKDFYGVISACAKPRKGSPGTWIHPEMVAAYGALFELGHAMSVEVWQHNELVGGLYGIIINNIFSGESMFHTTTDASKVALVHLTNKLKNDHFKCIDCQMTNPFLNSMGCKEIPRDEFIAMLRN